MIGKCANYDPFFRIKSSKKATPETKTTLDTLHNIQVQQMIYNESDLKNILKEKELLEEKIKVTANDIEVDQIENRIKVLNTEIQIRKDKNEFLDYFLDTGEILYKYYDIQEKIQNGTLPTKQHNRKQIGSIFDILEKAAKNEDITEELNINEIIINRMWLCW